MLNKSLCLRPSSNNFNRNYNKRIKIRMGIMGRGIAVKMGKLRQKRQILKSSTLMKMASFFSPVSIKIIIIPDSRIRFQILFNLKKFHLIKNPNKMTLSSHKHDLIAIYCSYFLCFLNMWLNDHHFICLTFFFVLCKFMNISNLFYNYY